MNIDDPSLRLRSLSKNKFKLNIPFNLTETFRFYSIRKLTGNAFKLVGSHIGFIIIVLFVLVGNISQTSAKEDISATNSLAGFTPEAIADITASVSHYTPNLEVKRDNVVLAMATKADNEYLNTPYTFNTYMTPDSAPPSDVRTQEITYQVSPGETLSEIGTRFGLRIATLQYVNGIQDADSIQPGQRIKIPVNNVSDSVLTAWLKQQESKQQSLAYSRQTVARSGSYAPAGARFIVPVRSMGISRGMTWYHTGIDYMTTVGTPIWAAGSGRVVEAYGFGWNYGWGKTILIDHGNGRKTRYGHLSSLNVSNGQWVSQGQVIGYTGNTGNSTGPHLHFELDVYGRPTYPF